MTWVFYISAAVALLASLSVVTARNAVHGALYLVISLLAVAVVFFTQGAALAAALEIIVYAGAIMVMILLVIMLLNLGRPVMERERLWLRPRAWIIPSLMVAVLAVEMIWILSGRGSPPVGSEATVKEVAQSLYGPYILAVELCSLLLLAGLVGAQHLTSGVLRRSRGGER